MDGIHFLLCGPSPWSSLEKLRLGCWNRCSPLWPLRSGKVLRCRRRAAATFTPSRRGLAWPGLALETLSAPHPFDSGVPGIFIAPLQSRFPFKRQNGRNSRTQRCVNISLSLCGFSKIYWRRRVQVCVENLHAFTSGRALSHIPCMLATHLLRMSICRASRLSIYHSRFNMRKGVMGTQTAASCTDSLNKSTFSSFLMC